MKYVLILLFFIAIALPLAAQETVYSDRNRLDINNATLEQIRGLPLDEQMAQRIYDYITYRGDLDNIYDLKNIEGVDQQLFLELKPLLRVEPFREISSTQERIEQVYFRLDQWSSNEGTNDAFIDLWIEKVLEPLNVNKARYDELINLQNVSPVDAVALINFREQTGGIRNQRDMRGIPGLSYYGYSNARNFVVYDDHEDDKKLHGHLTMRIDDTPFFADESEASAEVLLPDQGASYVEDTNTQPNQYIKGRFSYDQRYKFGFSYNRYIGEPVYYVNDGALQLPEMKWFAGVEDVQAGDFQLRKLYLGNYSVSFGQGIVMENTDFFSPRKSGFGFRKRFNGISGDNSRTRQYTLYGTAAEMGYGNFSAIGFVSMDDRDAILNKTISDSSLGRSFSQFIVLDQRFEYAPDDEARSPADLDLSWLDAVKELTYGGHLQYDFLPGTWLGVSYYESAYDRYLNPEPEEITSEDNWTRRQVTADSEIKQSYGGPVSRGSNPFWDEAKSFRRVYGFDFQTVIDNVAFMGEWGELDKGGSALKLGDDPKALVLASYVQFPSFNLLGLYRNYDVGFDNPYQRSFSNYRRFKGTIFEDYYYLQSSLYGQLYTNAPQPQAEEGFYLSTYYQLTRQVIARMEYDNWVRKADQASQYRLVGTVDYRPIFPLQIQLRQKWQSRDEENNTTLRFFNSNEFRARVRARLSNFDRLELIYSRGNVTVHPRPRVFGDINLDGEAFGAGLEHNFNNFLKLSGQLYFYKGFFWNFEDTQFVVVDSQRGAMRYWLSLYARLNSFLSMRLKYTGDFHRPIGNVSFNNVSNPEPGKKYGTEWNRKRSNYFYLELNYNF